MLTGFAIDKAGTCSTISSLDQVTPLLDAGDTTFWLDFEAISEEDLFRVAALFSLDPETVEDCLAGEHRARVDEYDEQFFMLLYGVVGLGNTLELSPRKLSVFGGERYLITVHEEPHRTIAGLRDRCARHAPFVLGKGADHLLYLIVDGMVDNYVLMAEKYEREIENLEELSLAPGFGDGIQAEIYRVRREIIDLRRVAVGMRDMLVPVARGEFEWISEGLQVRFDRVLHHILNTLDLLDGLRELLYGLRDNYHTTIAQRTNQIMKTLTVFSVILLPLTLISGVYGMNLDIWPGPGHPYAFAGVLGFMALVAAGMLVIFRLRKWM